MIPETKKNAVAEALRATFGTSKIEDISALTAGLSSAVVYRIVVLGKPYVLRIIMREDVQGNLDQQYANMRAAAGAGIAPRVWYTGMEDKISITDFIAATPFPMAEARVKLPGLLRKLHDLPPFSLQVNYLDAMVVFVRKFQAAKILPDLLSRPVFNAYITMIRAYPRNQSDMVSSHNDTKADNILFDGEQPWLVDWESAFLNDRYLDLAMVANFVVRSDEDEKEYLSLYFDEQADEYRQSRLFIMQQLLHLFYAAFLLSGPNAPAQPVDVEMARPGFRAFHDLLWNGKINIGNPENRLQYALVHLDQLMENLPLKRFQDAMAIMAQGPQNINHS